LAAEQRGYWWRFMVRCAAKALHELDTSVEEVTSLDATDRAAAITRALRGATGEDAWKLHNPDHSKPAFLQVPSPTADPADGGYELRSPSLLTAIIGSKNHDRKVGQRRVLDPEAAVFALVEYQTGSIYSGRGNYESQLTGSRSGKSSGTPFMGVRIGADGWSATFRHDTSTLLDRWDAIRRDHGLRGDVWSLWVQPWDGEHPLPAAELDPAFVPLARAVRLVEPSAGQYRALWFRVSKCSRVDDHTSGGNLGDIFTPLVPNPKTGAPKVRGTLEQGYGYREVVRLLFGEASRPSASVASLEGTDPVKADGIWVLFQGVAYDQGKTLGYHARSVALPDVAAQFDLLFEPETVRDMHEELLELVTGVQRAVTAALRILVHGDPKPLQSDPLGDAARQHLDFSVDQFYLTHLFAATAERKTAADEPAEAKRAFVEELLGAGEVAFEHGAGRAAVPSVHRLRRQVESEAYLRRRFRQLQVAEPKVVGG
jgi:hypothetical protein